MHMAFELAANKSHVCFIGTPHVDLSFTPAQWENMNRKEFKLTGSWMSYSFSLPGKRMGSYRTLFCNRPVEVRSGIYL